MKKTTLNQPKSFFIAALSMLLVLTVVVCIIPWVFLSSETALRLSFNNTGHEALNAVFLVYCVIMVLLIFIGTVSNQIATVRQDHKAIRGFWFLLADLLFLGVSCILLPLSKNVDNWLTPFVRGAYCVSCLFVVIWNLVCFVLFFRTEIVVKRKLKKPVV